MNEVTAPLLDEIDRFVREHRLSDSAFGLQAVNDHKLIKRLREGANVTSNTIARVRRYMAAKTPAIHHNS